MTLQRAHRRKDTVEEDGLMLATSGPSSLKAVRFGEEKATAEDAAGHLESPDGYETPDESIGDDAKLGIRTPNGHS